MDGEATNTIECTTKYSTNVDKPYKRELLSSIGLTEADLDEEDK